MYNVAAYFSAYLKEAKEQERGKRSARDRNPVQRGVNLEWQE
jgi:hypothetical protein